MALLRRRRRTLVGGESYRGGDHAALGPRSASLRLDTTYLGTQTWNGTRIGATATTSLHREHFTLNWQQMVARGIIPVVGSTIQIHLDIQAVLQL